MANIGLRNAKYNEIDYTTNKYKTLTNSVVPVLGKLIDSKLTENRSDVSLFADDTLAEYDSAFTGGSVALTMDDVDDTTYSKIKGCTINETEVTENENDSSPEIGYGHIITKMVNGVKKYKVEFLWTKIGNYARANDVTVDGIVMLDRLLQLPKHFSGMLSIFPSIVTFAKL